MERIRLSPKVRKGILSGRILLVSPFDPKHRRATAGLADQRNKLVAAIAASIFVSYAAPGGKTEALCREIIAMGKPLFMIDDPENASLLDLGAKPLVLEQLRVIKDGLPRKSPVLAKEL